MEITDKGTCPYCKREFEVDRYGRGFKCPYCGGKVDIFPDFSLPLEAGSWSLEIGFPPGAVPELARALARSTLWKFF